MEANLEFSSSLPSELWIEIFYKINSFTQLEQCSLVSQRWKKLAESVIFNRNITLTDDIDARAFVNYFTSNKEKRGRIKYLTMMPQYVPLGSFNEVLSLALTRNMEFFNGAVEGVEFFKVLLGIVGYKSKFKKLKTIPSAWTYSNVYDKLLYVFRNTLVDVKVNIRRPLFDKKVRWDTLRRLDKLKNLKSFSFNSYIHNIEETESILKNCNFLEELTIHLSLKNEIKNAHDIYIWMEENVKRNFTLKYLRVKVGQTYHSYLIDYLMYKYPNVKVVVIDNLPFKEAWGTYVTTDFMDVSDINSVLDKTKKVSYYKLECGVLEYKVNDMVAPTVSNQERSSTVARSASLEMYYRNSFTDLRETYVYKD
ncbi:hypothetical protein INT46_001246 [Mucor plumbeus]|uniref:F-box domain-containing protein n=1 Tax=Mucor plumbeus TaxID=97098 RepID=A0A8H7QXT4_9FUNG|nr:hypothetical protein INT46_001246 [Mucor plumbeus]